MNDADRQRYSRHIMLRQFGAEGQAALARASVLLIGLGGLGSPVAMYLAAAGVGRLVLVDPDVVELSNLQRQIIHGTPDLERLKVESARDRLRAINPQVEVRIAARRFYTESADELVAGVDLVVDGSDNLATRFAANAACFRHRKPLVSGAASRFDGQVAVFRPGVGSHACYRCLFDDAGVQEQTCEATGVIAPLLGIIGSVQALEAIKVLAGIGEDLCDRLLCLDALSMEWHALRVSKDPACPVCGAGAGQSAG